MNNLSKQLPFFTSALLMCLLIYLLYPYYQYYIDPDGTAYLTIAHRYAIGDYSKAINGYWSPWSCWLSALIIKLGINDIPASVIVNCMGAVGFIYISQSLFAKLKVIFRLQWVFNITLAIFLCYAVFDQSFDDIWECFFLLSTLRLLISDGFINKPWLWTVYGTIGALAYFAKAYSFPFFILNTLVGVWFITKGNIGNWLKICGTAITCLLFFSFPWILALHSKYGIWTTSTSGSLNLSWFLVGHPIWKDGIDLLLPSPYQDSPYYWEDPYFVNGITPHFWSSGALFFRQILKIGLNLYKLLLSTTQISIAFPIISLVLIKFALNPKARKTTEPTFILALFFILFPIGYILINFEPRYIWSLIPIGMIAFGLFYQNHLSTRNHFKIIGLLPYVIAISFLVFPIYRMSKMHKEGCYEYKIAGFLNTLGKDIKFTCKFNSGIEAQKMERLAYFSKCQFYSLTRPITSRDTLLAEMKRYHLNTYITNNNPGVDSLIDTKMVFEGDTLRFLLYQDDKLPGTHIYRLNSQSNW